MYLDEPFFFTTTVSSPNFEHGVSFAHRVRWRFKKFWESTALAIAAGITVFGERLKLVITAATSDYSWRSRQAMSDCRWISRRAAAAGDRGRGVSGERLQLKIAAGEQSLLERRRFRGLRGVR
jgi:hypothetical protein